SETLMRRSAAGEHRWSLTAFPTDGLAAEAGMSLSEYEDFFYNACLATDPDPVTAWARSADDTKRLTEWIQGKEEVHITAPGTDFGITDATRSILLDEKIGGTVHTAVGKSYPETGGVNESAVHWDMICDLRQGGRITVDGDDLQVDGRFVV